jgi:hypothetical protein
MLVIFCVWREDCMVQWGLGIGCVAAGRPLKLASGGRPRE